MKKVKILVETEGVGEVVYDEIREMIAKNNILFRLTTVQRLPVESKNNINHIRKEQ